ncbi:MAG: cation:proton antiporter [Chloroflexi bacterium]|nr:cation:proton antiporter [Chloroflexota bacterium]
MEQSQLVVNFTVLLGAALVGGMIAHRLRQPIILGYLIVGIAIGPHMAGLVNDVALIEASAIIGVALLMLTLGLEVSFGQFKQVGKFGLWGGLGQILATFVLGSLSGIFLFRWSLPQSVLFGLVISLSSTMVGLKILMERGETDSVHGRAMVAILILQDIAAVLMIIILPILTGAGQDMATILLMTVIKAIAIVSLAAAAGIWVLPWLMGRVGGVRARELFLLIVLVLGLGAALSTQLFGLSAVFGAFLIGLVLRETRFAHQALAEITPLRDIFAALFFVSLGMLLDPKFIVDNWPQVVAAVSLIMLIKFVVVYGIVRIKYTGAVAMLAGAGLLQIGEFSFILAQEGVNTGIISADYYSLIIGSAIITMLLTPGSIGLASWLYPRVVSRASKRRRGRQSVQFEGEVSSNGRGHVVVAGFGRIGQNLAKGLEDAGLPITIIESNPETVCRIRSEGTRCIYGDASNHHILSHVDLHRAKVLVVTYPDPLAVRSTVRSARAINPELKIIARVHRQKEADRLKKLGVETLINPEYEASLEFIRRTLVVAGKEEEYVKCIMDTARHDQDIVEFCPDKGD